MSNTINLTIYIESLKGMKRQQAKLNRLISTASTRPMLEKLIYWKVLLQYNISAMRTIINKHYGKAIY